MSLRHDYILRLIRQLAQAIGRLVDRAKTEDPEEIGRDLEETLEDLTGLHLDLLRRLPLGQLLGGLQMGRETDSVRTLAAAEVLTVDAELAERLGRPEEEVARTRFKALGLFAVALRQLGETVGKECAERAFGLMKALSDWRTPPAVGLEVVSWLERRGEYDRAENLLFDLLEDGREDRVVAAGLDFYGRLLGLDDDVLERGGLPRDEVLSGVKELESGQLGDEKPL